jgi:hypothetical protein
MSAEVWQFSASFFLLQQLNASPKKRQRRQKRAIKILHPRTSCGGG